MKIFFRISIILVAVLSAGALALGILLFQQRETLKGRNQLVEKTIKQVAATIETGDETGATITIDDNQLKTYKSVPGGPPPMSLALNQLSTAAQYQLEQLKTTRANYVSTSNQLAETEENLEKTITELDTAKGEINELHDTVAERDTTIQELQITTKNLEREKNECNVKIDTLKTEVEELEISKCDLEDQLARVENKVAGLQEQVNPKLARALMRRGQQGIILNVNPDWNFVIFGIAPESKEQINPDLELLVHRGDKLVGKVRVQKVVNDLAVAEIMNDWTQQAIKEYDNVIY